ncbi:MAG: sugar ABC transporter permease [Deltaproteobacteria bacterium]|jgi:multiple sugar transport system permease protein|nr:sugar ABC transporter permease [Deltaproteobacteria bacterium]MBT4638802.1 sugar ABC transporter permease [Deltaproteobacteria bacterium]MBT6502202.1 sugar ABC transporter permease [Deltaproteobacteria bacterium]MBT6612718.1 sugar ABC transporter permease [Deltaproteobacteria bacterium]MBT7716649.1 sugar ABC transporter permease [Deltaproteobacteria bacterium]
MAVGSVRKKSPSLVKRLLRIESSQNRLALTMNFPTIVFFFIILAYPIFFAGYLSFHKVSVRELRSGEYPFIGWDNFVRLFSDDVFWLSAKNTILFVSISVALEVLIALAIALIINESRIRLSKVTKLLILIPWAVPPVANGLLWAFIFNTHFGYLNRVLFQLGFIEEYVNWLGHSDTAFMAVIIAYVWRTTPFNILLYHAALQGIPGHLYEAAELDGTTGLKKFWYITLPLLRPIIAVTLILRTTFAFMIFDEIFAITQGGPGNDTWVAAWYTYKTSFQPPFNIGVGAASAYVLALVIGVIAIFYVKYVYRRVEY